MRGFFNTIFVIGIFWLGSHSIAHAQVRIFGGVSYTGVRNDVLEHEEAIYAWHTGGGVTITPKNWNKFSIGINTMVSKKGYKQYADKWYNFHFYYITCQPVIEYSPVALLSLEAGLDVGGLFYTDVKRGMSTYNQFDGGLVFGATVFNDKRIALYTRIVYGLVPMLTYDRMDALGNFTGEINDLKNTSVLFGLRVNVYHEKIPR